MGTVLTVGVIADTHIPDRVRSLHPQVLPIFQELGVEMILHAGDICAAGVLDQLEKVAPVIAVRGNRDVLLRNQLPMTRRLELGGVTLALMHGHGSMLRYVWDKWEYIKVGYRLERYEKTLFETIPDVQVVVFGHTHVPVNEIRAGKVLFNPGSAWHGALRSMPPTMGVLRISEGGEVTGELIILEGAKIVNGDWAPE